MFIVVIEAVPFHFILAFVVLVVVAGVISVERRLPNILRQIVHFLLDAVVLRFLNQFVISILVVFFQIPELLCLIVEFTLFNHFMSSVLILSVGILDFIEVMRLLQFFKDAVMFSFFHDWVIFLDWFDVSMMTLELLNDIDCDRAHISIYERHAPLRLARDEDRATATEAVSIMLAAHAIASVNSPEDIARKLGSRRLTMG